MEEEDNRGGVAFPEKIVIRGGEKKSKKMPTIIFALIVLGIIEIFLVALDFFNIGSLIGMQFESLTGVRGIEPFSQIIGVSLWLLFFTFIFDSLLIMWGMRDKQK